MNGSGECTVYCTGACTCCSIRGRDRFVVYRLGYTSFSLPIPPPICTARTSTQARMRSSECMLGQGQVVVYASSPFPPCKTQARAHKHAHACCHLARGKRTPPEHAPHGVCHTAGNKRSAASFVQGRACVPERALCARRSIVQGGALCALCARWSMRA